MSLFLLILGLVLFVGLVVVHEFGHFIAARRNDIEVEEFGVGFPPRAKVITTKKGTVYTLNWLPLGGFVKLKGEHDADTTKGSFGAASLSAKVKVMVAGVGMNLATAFVIFTFLALVGMPKLIDNQFTIASDTKVVKQQVLVGYVQPDSPAAKAGLEQRDQLVAISAPGKSAVAITSQDQLPAATKQFAGQSAQVEIVRNGETSQKTVVLRSQQEVDASQNTAEPKGYLGVSPTEYVLQRSTWSAPVVAAGLIVQLTEATLKGLGSAVSNLVQGNAGQASAQVSGPVGIFVLIKDGSLLGYQFILLIIAVISLTLAIMNILPIPALDGGRLFTLLFYKLIKKPLTPEREDMINSIGFITLMALFVLITIVDVKRNF
ncbi:MAG: Site-2 protease family protein [Patescibacteria group bacterium]|nr:Site-2 protease family protein [Patescibacteria group bacterium]